MRDHQNEALLLNKICFFSGVHLLEISLCPQFCTFRATSFIVESIAAAAAAPVLVVVRRLALVGSTCCLGILTYKE